MKRFLSIDIVRGVAILCVIFFHSLMYNADIAPTTVDSNSSPILQLISYFLYWAPAFTLISGIANTLSFYSRFREGKIKHHKMCKNLIITGFEILLLNFLYMVFFTPGHVSEELISIGILPGLMRYETLFISSLQRLVFSTTLVMLGTGDIVLGSVFFFLFRNEAIADFNSKMVPNPQRMFKNYLIVAIIGCIFLGLYPLLDELTKPLFAIEVTSLNFPLFIVLGWVTGDLNPMFPYSAFTCFGAIIGMMIVDKQPKKVILGSGYVFGGIVSAIALILLMINGYSVVAYQTPPLSTILLILGPLLLLSMMLIHYHDFSGQERTIRRYRSTRFSRRFGIISLSIFMWESTVSYLCGHLIDFIYLGWRINYGFMFFVFAPLMVVLWYVIVRLWAKIQFKGSFEWLILYIGEKISGKKSIRLNEAEILENVQVYLDSAELLTGLEKSVIS